VLSVLIRAVAVIALIFFYSPMRRAPGMTVSADALTAVGLRGALDHHEASPDWRSFVGLWTQVPPGAPSEAAGAVARQAAGALLKSAAAAALEPAQPEPASDAPWRQDHPRNARRIYP
jgi:hypothetical protein